MMTPNPSASMPTAAARPDRTTMWPPSNATRVALDFLGALLSLAAAFLLLAMQEHEWLQLEALVVLPITHCMLFIAGGIHHGFCSEPVSKARWQRADPCEGGWYGKRDRVVGGCVTRIAFRDPGVGRHETKRIRAEAVGPGTGLIPSRSCSTWQGAIGPGAEEGARPS
jgi:hypothetical protein